MSRLIASWPWYFTRAVSPRECRRPGTAPCPGDRASCRQQNPWAPSALFMCADRLVGPSSRRFSLNHEALHHIGPPGAVIVGPAHGVADLAVIDEIDADFFCRRTTSATPSFSSRFEGGVVERLAQGALLGDVEQLLRSAAGFRHGSLKSDRPFILRCLSVARRGANCRFVKTIKPRAVPARRPERDSVSRRMSARTGSRSFGNPHRRDTVQDHPPDVH